MEPIIQIGETGLDLIHLIAIIVALGLAAAVYRLNAQHQQEQARREELEAAKKFSPGINIATKSTRSSRLAW